MRKQSLMNAAVLAALLFGTVLAQQTPDITSFDVTGGGRLTFNEIPSATVYRVEWANALTGAWYVGTPGATGIVASGSGQNVVTVGVAQAACFYRVVASMTNATPPSTPSGMVLIPAGTNSGTDPDSGAYSLTVEAFYMDATEVTKAQWDAVYTWAIANGYTFANAGSGKAADHPVQTVSWYDCVKWCNARSQKEGKTPCYNLNDWSCNFSVNGYRLPTNTEWAYAARGGLSSKRFPWGDTISQAQANYTGYPSTFTYDKGYAGRDPKYDSYPFTSPAGAFAANGYGLYDMAGNVFEWCNDSAGTSRYIRGGSGSYDAEFARCGSGHMDPADFAPFRNGFRTVCR
jgi:formylglycine-generating enzyme required for sulfatase activity